MYITLKSITLTLLACVSISHALELQCQDDPDFTFGSYTWTNSKGSTLQTIRTCEWITAKNSEERKAEWCEFVTVLGATVKNKCQEACELCTDNSGVPDPERCMDDPFPTVWKDTEGRTCEFYEKGDNCRSESGRDEDGRTHTEACCGCSGGCYDLLVGINSDETWYDAGGPSYDCDWYAAGPDRCEEYGDSYVNFGKTANEVCCVCGAGERPGVREVRSRNLVVKRSKDSSMKKSRSNLRSKQQRDRDELNDRRERS